MRVGLWKIAHARSGDKADRADIGLFAWDAPGLEGLKTFHPDGADGKATVRNVTLPAGYLHVLAPVTSDLARSPAIRAWINAYDPEDEAGTRALPEGDPPNLLWAADVWHSLKRHWALEAQRFVRARRALAPG